MKAPRATIAYIVSLVVLGLLLGLTLAHPLVKGDECSAIQNQSLGKTDEGWMLRFMLVNPLPTDTTFTIKVELDGQDPFLQPVTIPSGRSFTFMMPVYADEVRDGSKLLVSIYKEQETAPFEQETFYLK